MVGPKHAFVKALGALTKHGRRHAEVFDDFLELAFCAIAKTTHAPDSQRALELEARYMALVGRREPDYVQAMPELLGLLAQGLDGRCDFLGEVAGELGALSEHLGQFFTPYHLSVVLAQLSLGTREELAAIVERSGHVTVDEPACGAGGMLLAVADVLLEHGFDPSEHLVARATDLSAVAYRMAYMQLSVRGIPAQVFHGNTLTLEVFGSEVTPALLSLRRRRMVAVPAASSAARAPAAQLDLFGSR
jgi:hypothetical protein